MISPTAAFDQWPALTPDEAADMICEAIRKHPARVATGFGNIGQIGYALAPGLDHAVNLTIARVRLGRRWRRVLAAGMADGRAASSDLIWREAFRRRLESTKVPTDPDEVRRLATLLGRIPLFETCTLNELHRLAATAYPIAFQEGDVVCAEGAESSDCYVVVEGELTVSIHGRDVGVVGANEVVGERGPIEGQPRSATVTAATNVLVYAISRTRLNALLIANAEAAAHMRRVVKARYAAPAVNTEPASAG